MDPQSATCARGREAGKSKGGSFSLLIWLLWHHTCCLVGLPTWNLSCFTHPSGLLQSQVFPSPSHCVAPRWALGPGGPVFLS